MGRDERGGVRRAFVEAGCARAGGEDWLRGSQRGGLGECRFGGLAAKAAAFCGGSSGGWLRRGWREGEAWAGVAAVVLV